MTERHTKNTNEQGVGRRRFLNRLWLILGGVVLVELVWVAISFLRPRKPPVNNEGAGEVVTAGPVSDFEMGTVTAFQRGKFYLVRRAEGGFLAISRKCTHLGCTVPWVEEEKKFICPCHASSFDMNGSVVNAPAPRALDLFPVSIENNVVSVNTGKTVRRNTFLPEQAVFPK
ncbi:MAG: Rieske 2Fe-2S domain-containing protein [Deltaproteobacteria bacterium]|nr:Rieske 2Fe-2S domain-containing protein [Deltaproteobacteria bacterium]MBW2285571.1 Rieske 2Fe-2S domain-containing protein [Deltaproteobacteria bacterium]